MRREPRRRAFRKNSPDHSQLRRAKRRIKFPALFGKNAGMAHNVSFYTETTIDELVTPMSVDFVFSSVPAAAGIAGGVLPRVNLFPRRAPAALLLPFPLPLLVADLRPRRSNRRRAPEVDEQLGPA